jgi:stage II sporulation protein R
MVLSIVGFASDCEDIRQSVLRLHVIAASDTDADQALKLKVRDAVLTAGADIFDGSVNVDNAIEKLTPRLHELESAAEKTVRENGCNYDVDVTLSREFFNTRTYEDITLPAGKYLAVRVVIDEGQGQNWWCVMFPSLCLSAARVHTDIDDVLDEKGVRIVEKNPRYEPRFKIIELIEKLKD